MIGSNIKKYRKALGLSTSYLAECMNISPFAVAMWESGFCRPNAARLNQLSQILCISVDELTRSDVDYAKKNLTNYNLLIANLLAALFCITAFITLWRYAPQVVPMHWSGGQIDRYGKKAELLIMIIVPIIFLAIDVLVYFPLKTDSGKASTYVSHFLFLFFQIGFAAMMLATYVKYIQEVLPFAVCTCASFALSASLAMHPKIIKKPTISVVKNKILSISSLALSTISLIIYILSTIPVSPLK